MLRRSGFPSGPRSRWHARAGLRSLRNEGLLATGRSAAYGRVLRTRMSMMHMGHATGVAAALTARHNAAIRGLDVKIIQNELTRQGFTLPDA